MTLPKAYEHHQVEKKWYDKWIEKNYFHAEVDSNKKPYCIVIPPPNVTGALHMGHALDNTMQDILIRMRRMQGYSTLWMPGTDHAGIATQAKVEESLAAEGVSRHDLGREAFLERVWEWKHQYGGRITSQLKSLGASCDWERERFTMDEGCSKAVREVFVRLFAKGLIYRGNRIINWCPSCRTALSDIEVDHIDRDGCLYHFRYPVKGEAGVYIEIATTRPETMLGDTAVAVHPEDERYRKLVGKTLVLPLLGREIPVVADESVAMEFGTGAVKITPAHDPNDFETGRRHQLASIVVITEQGTMAEGLGRYSGMDRFAARKAVVEDITKAGFFAGTKEHAHAVGQCSRCDTIVEPLVSRQWFVKMGPLAEPAMAEVLNSNIRIVPERFVKTYTNWLENIQDWCISRQLWWGHRIPVWYCEACGEMTVATVDPGSCQHCQSTKIFQDPDVLDTWFSSALWPFSTLGWPDKTAELEYFYPTSLLVTGRDIIFFWVARMIFMGLEFMPPKPFDDVMIHGLVLDAQGRKMSKSLGNGIDPVEVIDKYGADTLRFSLITGNSPGNDMRFQWERVESSRNFANKLWNATRFALMNLEGFDWNQPQPAMADFAAADLWIIHRYNEIVEKTTGMMERYFLGEAVQELYEFIWSEFCDWYIELSKNSLKGVRGEAAKNAAAWTLANVLKGLLELLHPVMPFITEELWQVLGHGGESIVITAWPQGLPDLEDLPAVQATEAVKEVIRTIRNTRSDMEVPAGKKIVAIIVGDDQKLAALKENEASLCMMARLEKVDYADEVPPASEKAVSARAGGVEVFMPLSGLVDLEKELTRLQVEEATIAEEIMRCAKLLSNPGFADRAPAKVVEAERDKLSAYKDKQIKVKQRMQLLGAK